MFFTLFGALMSLKVKCQMGQGHKRSRSGSKVKVTVNVKEKSGGLTPTSSCFIFSFSVYFSFRDTITLIGRNASSVDYLICSAKYIQNAVISRVHAKVILSHNNNEHEIVDTSRNGIFVNDVKIDGNFCVDFYLNIGAGNCFEIQS